MIDIVKQLADEFEDRFNDEFDENIFLYMTEAMHGKSKRTIAEAADDVVCALHGVDWEECVETDEYIQDSHGITLAVMAELKNRWARNY